MGYALSLNISKPNQMEYFIMFLWDVVNLIQETESSLLYCLNPRTV